MQQVKHVLTERFYAWEDAVKLARNDPEVDLSGEGPAYVPSADTYFEEGEQENSATADDKAATSQEREAVR